ncbi:MAG: CPBP family intramembrane glutamic endopeptidase [Chloroflexota bacterium]
MKLLSLSRPVLLALLFTLTLFLVRVVDVFIIRSDELLGEQVLTKVLGLILILAYAWSVKGSLRGIGLHADHWPRNVALGLALMGIALVIGYGVEWLTLNFMGQQPAFYFAAEGNTLLPNDAATGNWLFALTLIAGNVVNSFMEEGLFRGVLISHLGSRWSLAKANLAQAAIFGVWHIVWPLRDYLDGKTDFASMLGVSIGYILLSALVGLAWGLLFIKTNSLWTSWSAHTLNNTAMNLLHITTAAGLPSTLGLRVAAATLTIAALSRFVKPLAKFESWTEVSRS